MASNSTLTLVRTPWAAARLGVTLDTLGGDDYTEPQQLATELDRRGLAGIRAPARHDLTTRSNAIALFGRARAMQSDGVDLDGPEQVDRWLRDES